MSNLGAIQDTNQFPALTAHTGTAGTADVQRVVADHNGALFVNNNGASPTAGNNAVFALIYTGDNLTRVNMTIGTVTYHKNLGYDSNDNLTSVSSWS